jgi:hypothetical protein
MMQTKGIWSKRIEKIEGKKKKKEEEEEGLCHTIQRE